MVKVQWDTAKRSGEMASIYTFLRLSTQNLRLFDLTLSNESCGRNERCHTQPTAQVQKSSDWFRRSERESGICIAFNSESQTFRLNIVKLVMWAEWALPHPAYCPSSKIIGMISPKRARKWDLHCIWRYRHFRWGSLCALTLMVGFDFVQSFTNTV